MSATIQDKLDELADLCAHWKRNRERGKTPSAIQSALTGLAQEVATSPVALDGPATRTSHLLATIMRLRDLAPAFDDEKRADIAQAIEILAQVCRREAPDGESRKQQTRRQRYRLADLLAPPNPAARLLQTLTKFRDAHPYRQKP